MSLQDTVDIMSDTESLPDTKMPVSDYNPSDVIEKTEDLFSPAEPELVVFDSEEVVACEVTVQDAMAGRLPDGQVELDLD